MSPSFIEKQGMERTIKVKLVGSNQLTELDIYFRADSHGDLTRFALHAPSWGKIIKLGSMRGFTSLLIGELFSQPMFVLIPSFMNKPPQLF